MAIVVEMTYKDDVLSVCTLYATSKMKWVVVRGVRESRVPRSPSRLLLMNPSFQQKPGESLVRPPLPSHSRYDEL